MGGTANRQQAEAGQEAVDREVDGQIVADEDRQEVRGHDAKQKSGRHRRQQQRQPQSPPASPAPTAGIDTRGSRVKVARRAAPPPRRAA